MVTPLSVCSAVFFITGWLWGQGQRAAGTGASFLKVTVSPLGLDDDVVVLLEVAAEDLHRGSDWPGPRAGSTPRYAARASDSIGVRP